MTLYFAIFKEPFVFRKYFFLLFLILSTTRLESSEISIYLEEEKPKEWVWALIELTLKDGEYSYWLNPGEGGYAPSIDWNLPEGYLLEELIWEAPTPFTKLGQISYGYSKKIRALAKLKVSEEGAFQKGDLTLNYLTCDDHSCEPKSSYGEFGFSKIAKDPRGIQEKFDSIRQKIPLDNESLKAKLSQDGVEISIPYRKDVKQAWILPYKQGIVDPKDKVEILEKGSELLFSIPLSKKAGKTFPGILLIEENGQLKAWQLTEASFAPREERAPSSMGLFMALILAFLGGLILNLMPCVLPVLSLKILSFIELSKKEEKIALRYGVFFTLGVLASFWILGICLLLLRSYGAHIGWGFQLQHPIFVLSLLLLFFLMGLSLFGLFEWGSFFSKLGRYQKISKGGTVFLSGMFATLVATPCTGPLLGPALGLALTMDPPMSLTLLTVIGLGLSFPYLLFSASPSLLRFLPKPGPWLISFKQLMGFLMMATVIWFIWVLQDQVASNDLLFEVLLALLVIAFGAWLYGKFQFVKQGLFKKGLSVALVALGIFFAFDSVSDEKTPSPSWESYSYSKVESAIEQGLPVFIDFTAKWCLICQANKVVLDSDKLQDAFQKHNVLTLRADWTKKDSEITKALAKFGRSGVPLYVLYQKGRPPKVFSQLLSQRNIIAELEDAYVY